MKRMTWLVGLIILVVGIALLNNQTAPAAAGGFPCFLCHGVNFEGSDIAPAIAGTKLTDEQIEKQMRHPRGVMPAFRPSDFPDPEVAIVYIRSQPTGMPTLALSNQQRSAALALIAVAAAARATEYARTSSSVAVVTSTPVPGAPTPAASPTPVDIAARRDSSFSASAIAAVGGLIIVMVGVVWFGMRR